MPCNSFNLRTPFWWTTVVAILTIAVKTGLPAFEALVIQFWDAIDEFFG